MLHILMLVLISVIQTASFRSSMCLRENEQFSLCGWMCPPTCVNIRLLEQVSGQGCPSVWECNVGCRCSAGYIRDEYSKGCVLVNDCPDHYSCIANMKFVFGVITFAAAAMVVGSAPALSMGQVPGIVVDPRLPDYYRDARSQYPQYVSPCAAAAASAPIPAIAPAGAYQLNIAPYHGYPQGSQQYGYGLPHYRSAEMDPDLEIMGYSDMDRMMSEQSPMARYAYAAPAVSHAAYAPAASPAVPATSGPVFGVFPNANIGRCNVPLLFSCTPSVVAGHVVPSQSHYKAATDSYRGVDPSAHLDSHDSLEPTVHENLSPALESSHLKVNQ